MLTSHKAKKGIQYGLKMGSANKDANNINTAVKKKEE